MGLLKTQTVTKAMCVWSGLVRGELNQRTPVCPAFADRPGKHRFTKSAAPTLARDPYRLNLSMLGAIARETRDEGELQGSDNLLPILDHTKKLGWVGINLRKCSPVAIVYGW